MKALQLYILLALAFVQSSCTKEHAFDCFIGNGKEVNQERYPDPFRIVYIKDKVDVTIEEGNTYKVIVSTGEHLINNIKTEVKDNALYISNTSKCNIVRGYKRRNKVKVILPKLTYLENKGSNTVVFYNGSAADTIEAKAFSPGVIRIYGNFEYVITGSHGNGDIYLNGTTNRLSVFLNGNNYLYGENMEVKNWAFAESHSEGHCYLSLGNANLFEYRLWSKGNIYYTGDPKTTLNYTDPKVKGKAYKK
ncbi:MAG: DUF2807 domain-containing protein [Sediminibacterium sp.]|nr:DUF2807 domain-containing protein [Sediminibacterium sp.]